MKIAITGHTKGIGLALANIFKQNGHDVLGFSRSNGYDISQNRQAIIDASKDADVFINNAYHPTGQTLMLQDILNEQKLIVNISSKSIMYPTDHPNKLIQDFQEEYKAAKLAQQEIIRPLLADRTYNILNVIPGMVDAGYTKIVSPNRVKISAEDLAELIYNLIVMRDKMYVQEIVIDPPYQKVTD